MLDMKILLAAARLNFKITFLVTVTGFVNYTGVVNAFEVQQLIKFENSMSSTVIHNYYKYFIGK